MRAIRRGRPFATRRTATYAAAEWNAAISATTTI
jgi:hypothetical protein